MTVDRRQVRQHFDEAVARDVYRLSVRLATKRDVVEELRLAEAYVVSRFERNRPDPGVAYACLYDGCIVAANAILAAYGYRSSGDAGHEQAFRATEGLLTALGRPDLRAGVARVRTVLRRRRHEAVYETLDAVSAADVDAAHALALIVIPGLAEEAAAAMGFTLADAAVTFGRSLTE